MTTSVCQLPCLLYPLDPVWPSDPVPPPTPLDTDAVETEPTPKAPEPTPLVQPRQSVSNMKELQVRLYWTWAAEDFILDAADLNHFPTASEKEMISFAKWKWKW